MEAAGIDSGFRRNDGWEGSGMTVEWESRRYVGGSGGGGVGDG